MKPTVYTRKSGSVVISILQGLFILAGIICLIMACTFDARYDGTSGMYIIIGLSLLVSAALAIPFKTLVRAAEYYIGLTDAEYNITASKEEYDEAKAAEEALQKQEK